MDVCWAELMLLWWVYHQLQLHGWFKICVLMMWCLYVIISHLCNHGDRVSCYISGHWSMECIVHDSHRGMHLKSFIERIVHVWIVKQFCRYIIIYIWYKHIYIHIHTAGQWILMFNGNMVHTDQYHDQRRHWGRDKLSPILHIFKCNF